MTLSEKKMTRSEKKMTGSEKDGRVKNTVLLLIWGCAAEVKIEIIVLHFYKFIFIATHNRSHKCRKVFWWSDASEWGTGHSVQLFWV